MWEPPPGHPLWRMFAGVTEHAFITTLGVADPPLIDYVTGLLSRFLHADDLYRRGAAGGEPLGELTAMAAAADRLDAARGARREAHRHAGDFALFWSGFVAGRAPLPAFTLVGKRCYALAAAATADAEAEVLRRLRDEFEVCAEGLHEVRREFEGLGRGGPVR
jgi:hypothetical protein